MQARLRSWRDLVNELSFCGLLALVSMYSAWYRFSVTYIDAQQIPFVNSIVHPNLYPGDPMIATRAYYVTLYPYLLAACNRWISDLTTVYFIAQVISCTVIFFFIYRIGMILTESRTVALLATILAGGHLPGLYGFESVWRMFLVSHSHNSAAAALVLGSLYCFLTSRRSSGYMLLSFAAWIHSLSVLHFFLVWIAFDFDRERRKAAASRPFSWLEFCVAPATFIASCVPILFLSIKGGGALDPDWLTIFRNVSWMDSFVSLFPRSTDISFATFIALLLWILSESRQNKISEELSRMMSFFIAAVLSLCLIQFLGADTLNKHLVIILQLTRSTRWLCAIAFYPIALWMVRCWNGGVLEKISAGLIAVGILVTPYWGGVRLSMVSPLFEMGALVCLVSRIFSEPPKNRWRNLVWAGVFATLLGLYLRYNSWPSALTDLSQYFAHLGSGSEFREFLPVAGLALLAIPALWGTFRKWAPVAVIPISCVVFVSSTHSQRVDEAAWQDIQLWAKNHTEVSDVFVTPPWYYGFRSLSLRSTLAEWRDGTQQFFSRSYAREFKQRIRDVGLEISAPLGLQSHRPYLEMSPEKLHELFVKYNAKYYVLPRENLPYHSQRDSKDLPVYENKSFQIFLIR